MHTQVNTCKGPNTKCSHGVQWRSVLYALDAKTLQVLYRSDTNPEDNLGKPVSSGYATTPVGRYM